MGTCPQKVDVFAVQDRRKDGKSRPWIVRWRVEGRMVSRSFRTRGGGRPIPVVARTSRDRG